MKISSKLLLISLTFLFGTISCSEPNIAWIGKKENRKILFIGLGNSDSVEAELPKYSSIIEEFIKQLSVKENSSKIIINNFFDHLFLNTKFIDAIKDLAKKNKAASLQFIDTMSDNDKYDLNIGLHQLLSITNMINQKLGILDATPLNNMNMFAEANSESYINRISATRDLLLKDALSLSEEMQTYIKKSVEEIINPLIREFQENPLFEFCKKEVGKYFADQIDFKVFLRMLDFKLNHKIDPDHIDIRFVSDASFEKFEEIFLTKADRKIREKAGKGAAIKKNLKTDKKIGNFFSNLIRSDINVQNIIMKHRKYWILISELKLAIEVLKSVNSNVLTVVCVTNDSIINLIRALKNDGFTQEFEMNVNIKELKRAVIPADELRKILFSLFDEAPKAEEDSKGDKETGSSDDTKRLQADIDEATYNATAKAAPKSAPKPVMPPTVTLPVPKLIRNAEELYLRDMQGATKAGWKAAGPKYQAPWIAKFNALSAAEKTAVAGSGSAAPVAPKDQAKELAEMADSKRESEKPKNGSSSGVPSPIASQKNVEKEEVKFCTICACFVEKIFDCGTCGTVKYCSKKCQLDHWPKHKEDCKRIFMDKFNEAMVNAGTTYTNLENFAKHHSRDIPITDSEFFLAFEDAIKKVRPLFQNRLSKSALLSFGSSDNFKLVNFPFIKNHLLRDLSIDFGNYKKIKMTAKKEKVAAKARCEKMLERIQEYLNDSDFFQCIEKKDIEGFEKIKNALERTCNYCFREGDDEVLHCVPCSSDVKFAYCSIKCFEKDKVKHDKICLGIRRANSNFENYLGAGNSTSSQRNDLRKRIIAALTKTEIGKRVPTFEFFEHIYKLSSTSESFVILFKWVANRAIALEIRKTISRTTSTQNIPLINRLTEDLQQNIKEASRLSEEIKANRELRVLFEISKWTGNEAQNGYMLIFEYICSFLNKDSFEVILQSLKDQINQYQKSAELFGAEPAGAAAPAFVRDRFSDVD